MIRTNGDLHSPGNVQQYSTYNGVINSFYEIAAFPLEGRYNYIDSVYSGIFTPGKNTFRVNPVTILKAYGKSTNGLTIPVQTTGPTRRWLTGHIMCHERIQQRARSLLVWDTNLARLSLNKCYAKLNAPDADFAVMLGELRETLELLLHPFKSLDYFLHHFYSRRLVEYTKINRNVPIWDMRRTSDLSHYNLSFAEFFAKNAKNHAKMAADSWLMFRYGIMPLINDINSIIKLFADKVKKMLGMMYRQKASVAVDASGTYDFGTDYWNFGITTRETKRSRIVSTSILYYERVLTSTMDLFNRSIGFDLSQVPAASWELIKFSFVVDWIFRVGDWLQAIMPNSSLRIVGGCTSQVIETTLTYDPIRTIDNNLVVTWSKTPQLVWTIRQLIRNVDSSKPALPAFNPNFLNIKRTLDTLALLWRPINKRFIRG